MFALVVLFTAVLFAQGGLPYNEGGEQQCSSRERQEMGEPIDDGALLEQFVKAYLGITFAELKSNAQVQPCYTPSKCTQQWSRLGFKHLREEFLRYRAKSLDSKANFLQKIFNVLTLPYSYIAALQPALERTWLEVPFEDREEYRRKFCAFRILDENSSIKYTVKT